jgi:PAS domain S-box-containing protein
MPVEPQTDGRPTPDLPVRGSDFRPTKLGGPEEAVFRDLVDAAACMMVVLRPDGTVAYWNAFAEELTGYAAGEVTGSSFFELFLPESTRGEMRSQFARVLAGAPRSEIECPLVARRAPVRWIVCSLRALGDYRGESAVLLTAQDITVHKHTERKLRRRTHDLGERVKELNCLFGLSKLDEEPDIGLEGILQGLVDILPPGWQYPKETCARIVFQGKEYRTYNFNETRWKQAAPIVVRGDPAGMIEVYYLEEKPAAYEGPFLAEERRLLDALAQRLGRIAERIKGEQELRRERDFAESLIETAPAIVLVLDEEGRIVRINPYMEEISGYHLKDVKGKDWFKTFLPKRLRRRLHGLFVKALSQKQRAGVVGPIVTKDGREREIEWHDKLLQDAGGNVVGLLAIGQDITDRRRLEKEIVSISTREQQRIGQELHDGLGQELTGLGYLAETLYCDLRQGKAAEAQTANRLADGVERALEQARTIAKGLVPVEIDADGLVAALEQLASQTEHRCRVRCRCHCSEPAPVGDTATATQLFRIIQEAINNAVKHARAKQITVEVRTDAGQITFQVRDDGVGLPAEPEQTAGMGLRIMHHRAGVIGATLNVRPADGGGTLVTCVLPRGDAEEHENGG